MEKGQHWEAVLCDGEWYKATAIGAPLIHAQRRGGGMGGTALFLHGAEDGNALQPLDLFWLVGMKTTCTASELGKSVQAFIIRAVQRQTAWNPLTGEVPAPSGSCLA